MIDLAEIKKERKEERKEVADLALSVRELVVEMKRDREEHKKDQERLDKKQDERQARNEKNHETVLAMCAVNSSEIVKSNTEITKLKGPAEATRQLTIRIMGGLFSTAFIGAFAMYFTMK